MKKKTRNLTKNEMDLWNHVTSKDHKLLNKNNYVESKINKFNVPNTKVENISTDIKHKVIKENQRDVSLNNLDLNKNNYKEYESNGNQIDNRTRTKLQRGLIRPTAKIDLHGYNRIEAFDKVRDFIKACVVNEERCILVITGRKIGMDGPKGIIRNYLPIWLQEKSISPNILYYTFAHIKDGGDGATYVLLRKRNKIRGFNERR